MGNDQTKRPYIGDGQEHPRSGPVVLVRASGVRTVTDENTTGSTGTLGSSVSVTCPLCRGRVPGR